MTKRVTVYFAHPVTDYGTQRQAQAIAYLSKQWQVVNPGERQHQERYATGGMAYFAGLAAGCDILAFMRFPDGSIGAGVGKEIEAAQEAGVRWIVEYFNGQCYPVQGFPTPVLSVAHTRALISKLRGEVA